MEFDASQRTELVRDLTGLCTNRTFLVKKAIQDGVIVWLRDVIADCPVSDKTAFMAEIAACTPATIWNVLDVVDLQNWIDGQLTRGGSSFLDKWRRLTVTYLPGRGVPECTSNLSRTCILFDCCTCF